MPLLNFLKATAKFPTQNQHSPHCFFYSKMSFYIIKTAIYTFLGFFSNGCAKNIADNLACFCLAMHPTYMLCLYILALSHLFTLHCVSCVFAVLVACVLQFVISESSTLEGRAVNCIECVCVYLFISVSFSHSSSFSIALIHWSYLSVTNTLPGSSFRKLCHGTQRTHLVNTLALWEQGLQFTMS